MADNNLGGLGDETLANAQGISRAMNDIAGSSRNLNRELGESLTTYSNYFTTVKNSANKVAEIQNNALKTQKAANQALGEQSKQLNTVRALNLEINKIQVEAAKALSGSTRASKEQGALLKIQAELLAEARDNAKELASVYGGIARDATKLDGKTKLFTKLADVAKSIPVLGKLATPFEKAAEAARKIAVEQAKVEGIIGKRDKSGKMRYYDTSTGKSKRITDVEGESAMATQRESKGRAGMKAMGGEMMSSIIGGGGWIGLLIKALQFVFDIFAGAQENTINIAKNLGIARESANKMRLHFIDIATNSDNILVNSKSLIAAQSALVDNLGVYTKLQDSTLTNQVFLTENLGLTGDAASDLNLLFEAQGQNAEKVTNSMNETNNAAAKVTGRMVPFNKLMSSVAKTSLEIKGYFGFNVKAIAEGVRQMSKFGLELKDAASVSKTLLDFESSIGNELTLELLTGKEFNLEKARSKALTGDIAGATADVMQQMQGLTEEQRKNPLIMESMAAMSGLSADQINRAYLVNQKLTQSQKDYVAELQKAGKEKEANAAQDMAMNGATVDDMKRQLTVSQAFSAAMEKLKDKLGQLDQSGALDTLTDAIIDFSYWIGEMTGANERKAAEQGTTAVSKGIISKSQNEELQEKAQDQGWFTRGLRESFGPLLKLVGMKDAADVDRDRDIARAKLKGSAEGNSFGSSGAGGSWGSSSNPAQMSDFVIKPLGKDTISMAGGTKLGGNVEALLQELIAVAKSERTTQIRVGANSLVESIGYQSNAVGS
jgi:hypothetical protein